MKSLSTSTILMVVAASLIFFFVGRFTAPVGDTASSVAIDDDGIDVTDPKGGDVIDVVSNPPNDVPADPSVAVNSPGDVNEVPKPGINTENPDSVVSEGNTTPPKIKPVETSSPIDPIETVAVSEASLARVKIGISDKKIAEVLSSVAQNLEDKQLAYVSSLMQDCSGIFHQMKDSLQTRLPALAGGSQYQYPSPKVARSSRQIADWYHKNNNLLIVQDPIASANSIRPGAVMFYGKSNRKFTNIDIDMLTDRDNNYTSNGAIQHIAVVTAVTLDEDGNVVDYTIMHGRRPGKVARRSGSKKKQSRTKTLPAFGHWSQQWVGIANMTTPKK